MGHALINFKDTIYYNEDSLLVTVTSKITVNHLNRIFFIDSRLNRCGWFKCYRQKSDRTEVRRGL